MMTSLSTLLSEYLDHRRRFGADMASVGKVLKPFVAFADAEGAERVTTGLFLRWKAAFGSAGPNTWGTRLGAVRSFATWLQGIDGRHEVPPKGLVRKRRARPRPYIYSEAEIGRIVAAAAALPSPSGLRGATCSTLFGLISVTGPRTGEALGLDDRDVDAGDATLAVRCGKNGRGRVIPVTRCVVDRLQAYQGFRDRAVGHAGRGPEKPAAPQVGVAGTAIAVAWTEPESAQAVSRYDVRYGISGSGSYVEASVTAEGALILWTSPVLMPGRSYEVMIRAESAAGLSPWSEAGVGHIPAVGVGFAVGSYTATEGGLGAEVTVLLGAAAADSLEVPVTLTAGAGTEPDDYAPASATLTFAAGELGRVLTVTASEDEDSAEETVELSFVNLPLGVTTATTTAATATATVTLADNDPLTVMLTGPTGPVDGVFEVRIAFTEEVTGFEADEVTVAGGTVELTGGGAEYTATVMPDGAGTVTVDVAAGVVDDDDGSSGNEAAQRLSVTVMYDCASGVAVEDPANNGGLVADCEALLATRDELAGTAALNWSGDLALSSWDGVTTGGDPERITGLDLSGRQLDGAIPAGIGSLAELTALDLSGNDLSGLVPSELGSLSGLTELYLQGNRLSGCVPSALGSIAAGSRDFGELRLCGAEPPRPLAPAVSTAGPTSLAVAWTEPPAAGVVIASYDVRYRKDGEPSFTAGATGETGTGTTIGGLASGSRYEVQVRANGGGDSGPWSPSGYGDTGMLSVTFAPGPFTAQEGGTGVAVVVALSAQPAEEILVPIDPVPRGTTEAGDYALAGVSSGALSFAVDQQTATITVTAAEDHDSVDETVELRFGVLPVGVAAGTLTSARVGLTDNDTAPLQVSFGNPAYTAREGTAGATIPVRLNQPALRELRVPVIATPRGTTTAADYAIGGTVAGVVTFAVGEQTRYVTVVALDDEDAADEAVVLSFGAGVAAGTAATAEVTLEDDDGEPLTISFDAASYTAVEGQAGVWVTVELSQATRIERTVLVTMRGRGTTAAGDYRVSGLSADYEVTFAPGERTRLFAVMAEQDADAVDEQVVLGFGAGVAPGPAPRAVVTLQDDDAGGVSFAAAKHRMAEDGFAQVTVKLVPAARELITIPVTFTPQGSTTQGEFREFAIGPVNSGVARLTFEADVDEKTFVLLNNGDDDSDDEVLELGFGELPRGVSAGALVTSTVTVVDDDGEDGGDPLPQVSFVGSSYPVPEGGDVLVTVQVAPTVDNALPVPIRATARGTTASSDYTVTGLTGNAVSIAAGESTAVFTIAANEDGDAADEVVELEISSVPPGTKLGVQATTEVVLNDNDTAAMAVHFAAPAAVAVEGGAPVAVAVRLTQAARAELAVPVTVSPRGTTAVGDWAVGGLDEDGAVTFSAGESTRTLTVRALQDTDAASEVVVLGFGGGPVAAGETPVSVITLQDNDTSALHVTFDAASYTATEGGAGAQVAVTLNQPAASELALPIAVTARGTTQERDYTVAGLNSAGALVFSVGETSQTFTVGANVDDGRGRRGGGAGHRRSGAGGRDAGGGSAPAGAAAGVGGRRRDDRGGGQFRAGPLHGGRGRLELRVTVRLSAALTEPVAVPVTATPHGDTETVRVCAAGPARRCAGVRGGGGGAELHDPRQPGCRRRRRDPGGRVRRAAGRRGERYPGHGHGAHRRRRARGPSAHRAGQPRAAAAPRAGHHGERGGSDRRPDRGGARRHPRGRLRHRGLAAAAQRARRPRARRRDRPHRRAAERGAGARRQCVRAAAGRGRRSHPVGDGRLPESGRRHRRRGSELERQPVQRPPGLRRAGRRAVAGRGGAVVRARPVRLPRRSPGTARQRHARQLDAERLPLPELVAAAGARAVGRVRLRRRQPGGGRRSRRGRRRRPDPVRRRRWAAGHAVRHAPAAGRHHQRHRQG